MTDRLSSFFVRYAERRGLTLVEVVAATALVGALLSATLVAVGRHTWQVRRAQDRIAALKRADAMLKSWLIDGLEPEADEGVVVGHEAWRWRLRGEPSPGLSSVGAHVGRIEIIKQSVDHEVALAQLEFVSTSPLTAAHAGVIPR